MDGFQLPLCAQLRQALCLLGIGANIWDKCNLPPAIRYKRVIAVEGQTLVVDYSKKCSLC